MKKIIILLVVSVLIVGLGFLFFTRRYSKIEPTRTESQKKILYWTCNMHPSVKSDKPGNCPICNMVLTPVYEEEKPSPALQVVEKEVVYYGCGIKEEGHCPHCDKGRPDANCICGGHSFIIEGKALAECPVCKKPLKEIEEKDMPKQISLARSSSKEKRILYYRNPMDPNITSPVPMKDSMGMDYIPVYEEEVVLLPKEVGSVISRVRLSRERQELSGIKTVILTRQHLFKEIRTVGKVAFDPELAVAQEEFLTALQTREKVKDSPDPDVISRADDLVEKSKFKLRLLGMSNEEIEELKNQGETQLNLVLPEDKAWVYADVYEYELGWVKPGQDVLITTAAYAGEEFKGKVKAISPVLNPMTRSAKIRIETDNIEQKLKPEMFVDVIIESMYLSEDGSHEVLAIQRDAVLDTGTRKIVYVDKGDGRFFGKEIKIGPEAIATIEGEKIRMYPVLKGLSEGEVVVTKGNFLIDSQSQLTGGMSVLWGGAQEMKTEPAGETQGKIQTQHRQ